MGHAHLPAATAPRRRGPRRRTLAALALVAGTLTVASPAVADHVREGNVRFKVTCELDASAPVDPIVFPGVAGASHRHDFFGQRRVDENTTTYAQLQAGRTTCNDPGDLAAYWAPAVRTAQGWAEPGRLAVYYRRGNKHGDIEPYPAGLKVVAGYPSSPAGTYGWQCGTEGPEPTPIEDCGSSEQTMRIEFPDCWNGVDLDSADHRSHMAYSVYDPAVRAQACPASHPVPVPEATAYVNLPGITRADQITGLASGSVATVHADLFNGWDVARLAERVATCLNDLERCDSGG